MQILMGPTAIISKKQTFDRSTFSFFKNSIFSACYYHCYLFECVDGGVGGRVMLALAWQPVTEFPSQPMMASSLTYVGPEMDFFPSCVLGLW